MKKNLQVSKRHEGMVHIRKELLLRTPSIQSQGISQMSDRRSAVNDRGRMFQILEVYS